MYKRGWYKKGNRYRFVTDCDSLMVYYQTESKFGSNHHSGEHLIFGKWFKDAEYIGMELVKSE